MTLDADALRKQAEDYRASWIITVNECDALRAQLSSAKADARREALEEAAKRACQFGGPDGKHIAGFIRTLIDQPAPEAATKENGNG